MASDGFEFAYIPEREQAERRAAMLGVVGLWRDRSGIGNGSGMEDAESFIRNLRDDDRPERLEGGCIRSRLWDLRNRRREQGPSGS